MPNGYVMIDADGRMIAPLIARNGVFGETKTAMANLFGSMVCDAGTYRLCGDRFVAQIGSSWDEK